MEILAGRRRATILQCEILADVTEILIEETDPRSPDVVPLLQQLDDYLNGLYPPGSNHILSVDALARPGVTFLTAKIEGEVVGCGAVVERDGAYAEIKRMFVLPRHRGHRIGQRLLEVLEARTRAMGLTLLRLETGVSQPEALRLYECAGYHRREAFGDYPVDPMSVFMEKDLSNPSRPAR